MNYFFDTEFIEGPQKKKFLGFTYGKTLPTIDLISIGLVAEDGREYSAVHKNFNLSEAWNRYDIKVRDTTKYESSDSGYSYTVETVNFDEEILNLLKSYKARFGVGYKCTYKKGDKYKEHWLRYNVLLPLHKELSYLESLETRTDVMGLREHDIAYFNNVYYRSIDFTYSEMQRLINKYGKDRKTLAREIKNFVLPYEKGVWINEDYTFPQKAEPADYYTNNFYAYFADYDWVVFAWIFGRMIDMPNGFPWYCRDLKQIFDSKVQKYIDKVCYDSGNHTILSTEEAEKEIKNLSSYPKQENEHNACADAWWNKNFYDFLMNL